MKKNILSFKGAIKFIIIWFIISLIIAFVMGLFFNTTYKVIFRIVFLYGGLVVIFIEIVFSIINIPWDKAYKKELKQGKTELGAFICACDDVKFHLPKWILRTKYPRH